MSSAKVRQIDRKIKEILCALAEQIDEMKTLFYESDLCHGFSVASDKG